MFDYSKLSLKERAVYDLIAHHEKITQLQIARSEQWLGCHEKYEGHLPIDKMETTLRHIRKIIRDLRMVHDAPIVSGIDGYFIPKDDYAVSEYIRRMEGVSGAQARSWMETYRHMVKVFGDAAGSDYFDGQQSLF